MNCKKLLKPDSLILACGALYFAFLGDFARAQFSLGAESGIHFPISKEDRYSNSFFISPKIELPIFSLAYSLSMFPAEPNIALHTLDLGLRTEMGHYGLRPYLGGGVGYALFNTPQKYLNGVHFFGNFGLNWIVPDRSLALGPAVRYNFILYDADEYFATGEEIAVFQYLTLFFLATYAF
jgi:hypothetical protein